MLFIHPKGKGAWGKQFVVSALSWIFSNTDAERVWGKAARAAAKQIRLAYEPPNGRVSYTGDETKKSYMCWEYLKKDWVV